jgi:uncharacterized membrane protein
LGYQKYYKPEHLAEIIQEVSQVPVLIATTHNTHVQTGEIMGIAWEWQIGKRDGAKIKDVDLSAIFPLFLLAHQEDVFWEIPEITLQKTLDRLQKPLDLWLVNFHTNIDLELYLKAQNCVIDSRYLPSVDGYNYQLYHCLTIKNI